MKNMFYRTMLLFLQSIFQTNLGQTSLLISLQVRVEQQNFVKQLSNVFYTCPDLERATVSSQAGLKAVFRVAFRNVSRYFQKKSFAKCMKQIKTYFYSKLDIFLYQNKIYHRPEYSLHSTIALIEAVQFSKFVLLSLVLAPPDLSLQSLSALHSPRQPRHSKFLEGQREETEALKSLQQPKIRSVRYIVRLKR